MVTRYAWARHQNMRQLEWMSEARQGEAVWVDEGVRYNRMQREDLLWPVEVCRGIIKQVLVSLRAGWLWWCALLPAWVGIPPTTPDTYLPAHTKQLLHWPSYSKHVLYASRQITCHWCRPGLRFDLMCFKWGRGVERCKYYQLIYHDYTHGVDEMSLTIYSTTSSNFKGAVSKGQNS